MDQAQNHRPAEIPFIALADLGPIKEGQRFQTSGRIASIMTRKVIIGEQHRVGLYMGQHRVAFEFYRQLLPWAHERGLAVLITDGVRRRDHLEILEWGPAEAKDNLKF